MSDTSFETMYGNLAGALTVAERADLDERGYTVVENAMDADWRHELCAAFDRIVDAEGDLAATVPGTRYEPEPGAPRIAYCVNRGPVFEPSYTHPKVLAAARHVIGRPFKLHGLNARDVRRGQGRQNLHADHARSHGDDAFHLLNTLWLLDDVTATNGPTRIVPGSHRVSGPIGDHVDDVHAAHPDEVTLTGAAGTVVVFNGHCWHGGTANVDGSRRRVLHVSYVARDRPQQVDCAAVTTPETAARLSADVHYLLDLG